MESISFIDENNREIVGKLLTKYGIATVSPDEEWPHFALVYRDGKLGLLDVSGKIAKTPLVVDFVGGAMGHRRGQGIGRQQPLARAFGLHKSKTPKTIVDATAGLGRDAFVLASCGCQVVMTEQSPAIAALLDDGLARALESDETAPIIRNLELIFGSFVSKSFENRPFGVYLDPMFPVRDKSALVKKEMQLFHHVAAITTNEIELLDHAMAVATDKVVVKRPKGAPHLAGRSPTYVIETKQMRFDVYGLG